MSKKHKWTSFCLYKTICKNIRLSSSELGLIEPGSIERHQDLDHALSVTSSELRKRSIRRKELRSHTRAQLDTPSIKARHMDHDMYKSNLYQPRRSDQCWWQDSFLENTLSYKCTKIYQTNHYKRYSGVKNSTSWSADWKTNVKCKHFQSATGQERCERFTGKLQI